MASKIPPTAPSAPSVAAAIAVLASWADLPAARRQALRRALKVMALAAGTSLEATALTPGQINRFFATTKAAQLGLSAASFSNIRAQARYALRRLGLMAPRRSIPKPVDDPNWGPLLTQLPGDVTFHRLRLFAAYCAENEISPQAVCPATLESYAAHREATMGSAKGTDAARRVANLWRKAALLIPEWPQEVLAPKRIRQISLDFDQYPSPLASEANAYLKAIAAPTNNDSIFSRSSSRPPVRPATVTTRRFCLRRLLHGALQNGFPMEQLNSLRVVTNRAFLEKSLTYFYERNGRQKNADLAALAATAASVAHYLQLDDAQWTELRKTLAAVNLTPQREITEKTAALLHELDDPHRRAKLLHLPSHLMKRAATMRDGSIDKRKRVHAPKPIEAAWLAGIAVAIEISLHLPLRIANLVRLRIGKELTLAKGARDWQGRILIHPEATKNSIGHDVHLPRETTALIREYLNDFRKHLPNAETDWLFPGRASPDQPRDKPTFGVAISETIERFVGLRINPHAFRAFAATMILENNPAALDDVRALLGHTGFKTALKHYRRQETQSAAARHAQYLRLERRSLPGSKAAPKKRGIPSFALRAKK